MKKNIKKTIISIIVLGIIFGGAELARSAVSMYLSWGDITIADPGADALVTYDFETGNLIPLRAGTGISFNSELISATSTGDVTGPASSTDNQIALFNLATGKIIKAATNTGFLTGATGVLGSTAYGGANRYLGVNAAGTGAETKTVSVTNTGTTFNITHGVGTVDIRIPSVTPTNNGVITTGSDTLEGQKFFNQTGGTTATAARVIMNQGLSASAGIPVQDSPRFQTFARAWNTTSLASHAAVWETWVRGASGNPVQGTLSWCSNINNAGCNTRMTLSDIGLLSVDNAAVKAGTSTGHIAKVGGTIYQSTTTANNSSTTETDLYSQSIPANVLATNGDAINFFYTGTIQTSLNNKQLRVKFGATTCFDSTAQNPAIATTFRIHGRITRTGATTQKCEAELSTTQGSLYAFTGYSTAAETLSGAVTLKLTGQGGASNETTFEVGRIKFEAAP